MITYIGKIIMSCSIHKLLDSDDPKELIRLIRTCVLSTEIQNTFHPDEQIICPTFLKCFDNIFEKYNTTNITRSLKFIIIHLFLVAISWIEFDIENMVVPKDDLEKLFRTTNTDTLLKNTRNKFIDVCIVRLHKHNYQCPCQ